MRRCSDCGESKPQDEFYAKRANCKPCERAKQRVYHEANRDKLREGQAVYRENNRERLKRRRFEQAYNTTWEEREAMLTAQGGVCAICQSDDPAGPGWHMDHDHSCCPEKARSCGKCVRGLLCGRCNIAIGCLNDNPEVILRAAEYVSRMQPF